MAKNVLKNIKAAPDAKPGRGEATGKPVVKTTDKRGLQSVKAKAAKPDKAVKGLWGIRAGSRKEQVAIALDAAGREAAIRKAESLGIKPGTVKSWIGTWRREGRYVEAVTPKAKAAVKAASEALQDIAADAAAEGCRQR
ncbi:MAG: hypothetical protein EOS25_13910 [Mesorhizobium sp.]|uniref:hypothetical protein n=1 Tax=Mesorhizobium sp. TaxID=1871066 RepID=UPI000FEA15C5|nr:hypothetical protein [Mesorhizobium sp.]RWD51236.1 MAG: hypothetical protein EOS59_06515 [Mesorhizobium sp.]RWE60072.1 MAG: hypothetical protein EOS24_13270 [Mesorhizobium sp.]RWF11527.1 MAG: hypothetical protein EOS69_08790 [Mesorhizobium sp.]RWF18425.1 MAG: hypothetical protein EOS25_13910 [Mesorhizobium sp.]